MIIKMFHLYLYSWDFKITFQVLYVRLLFFSVAIIIRLRNKVEINAKRNEEINLTFSFITIVGNAYIQF